MAKHKLTQLKQLELPIHEYIAKIGDMVEHAYNIKPTDSASIILASNFNERCAEPSHQKQAEVLPGQKPEGYF